MSCQSDLSGLHAHLQPRFLLLLGKKGYEQPSADDEPPKSLAQGDGVLILGISQNCRFVLGSDHDFDICGDL